MGHALDHCGQQMVSFFAIFIMNKFSVIFIVAYFLLLLCRRDKSRGYAWNKDKEGGASSNTTSNSAAVELPDGVKRKLWSALTVLSHALPGCEPVRTFCFSTFCSPAFCLLTFYLTQFDSVDHNLYWLRQQI